MGKHKQDGEISIFENVFQKEPTATGSIIRLLEHIKSGFYKEEVDKIRALDTGSKLYKETKKRIPCATISGTFKAPRNDSDIVSHSGFICMDFDHVPDIVELEKKIRNDEFTFGLFRSISNEGLACIVKISKPEKHRDYFHTLRQHYREKYRVEVDPKCVNESRLRLISYDPDTYVNTNSSTWSKVSGLAKASKPAPKVNIIATKTDFDRLINEITKKGIDITDGYDNWLSVAFALADEFGEAGRQYFHAVSSVHPDYDSKACDKQYDHCVRTSPGDKITIGTFFYFCKQAGLSVSSNEMKEAVNIVKIKKASKSNKEEVKKYIDHIDIPDDDKEYIIEEVYNSPDNLRFAETLPLIERVRVFIMTSYHVRRNELTRVLEFDGEEENEFIRPTIYSKCLSFVDEKCPKNFIDAVLDGSDIPSYNPFVEFIERNSDKAGPGLIDQVADSIPSDTWLGKKPPQVYKREFFKKWYVGMIAGVFGTPNPFVLALVGAKPGTGKTHFFRYLLPKELKRFYDESPLDSANESENMIRLSRHILIMDDEGGSRNYKQAEKFKRYTSMHWIKYRKLYSNTLVKTPRLATLCLTANETDIIKDHTGNRRIIPIHVVEAIDRDLYNSVDKLELFMEGYALYKSGFNLELNTDEITALSEDLEGFKEQDIELEMIAKVVRPGEFQVPTYMVFRYLNLLAGNSNNISTRYAGRKIKRLGIKKVKTTIGGDRNYCYCVAESTFRDMKRYFSDLDERELGNQSKMF